MKKFLLISALVFASAVSAPSVYAASCVAVTANSAYQYFPGDNSSWRVAEKFTLVSQCDVSTVTTDLSKDAGVPDDGVFYIMDDLVGSPNNILSGPVAVTGVQTYPLHGPITASMPVCLAAGDYWAVVGRASDAHGGSAFEWWGAAGTYTQFKYTGAWASLATNVDQFLNVQDGGSSCGGGGGGGTTSTSTVQYVDNYNQDTALIVLAFMGSFWFAIWLFRKRN